MANNNSLELSDVALEDVAQEGADSSFTLQNGCPKASIEQFIDKGSCQRKILIVDDNLLNIDAIKILL